MKEDAVPFIYEELEKGPTLLVHALDKIDEHNESLIALFEYIGFKQCADASYSPKDWQQSGSPGKRTSDEVLFSFSEKFVSLHGPIEFTP